MVLAIVLIVSVAGVLRAKYAGQERDGAMANDPEALRMRDELKALKERVAAGTDRDRRRHKARSRNRGAARQKL